MPELSALLSLDSLIALVTLTALEVVLGIDNIVFVVVLTNKLDPAVRNRARRLGLGLAMVSRIALLFALAWILRLTAPLFSILQHEVSGRDIVLLAGGLFLLAKATLEIHEKIATGHSVEIEETRRRPGYLWTVSQIAVLDIVFSLDSVITAVGMARQLWVMVTAIVIAVAIMLIFSSAVSKFVSRHPTIQMLAFSFLLLVGVFLVAEGMGRHIDRGYIYFAMAFSLFVEVLNMRLRKPAPAEAGPPRP